MDYKRILKEILNIGREMLRAGAEVGRVEDSMYRMCKSYGFTHADIWVIYSNIQATVETAEGDIITQIRHIPSTSSNFDKLDYLNNLSRRVCRQTPSQMSCKHATRGSGQDTSACIPRVSGRNPRGNRIRRIL